MVFWRDIEPGQKITITDGFWTNASGFLPAEEGEAHISFVPLNQSVPAGTVLRLSDFDGELTYSYVNGDQTMVYTGTKENPTFLCAMDTTKGGWSSPEGICNDDCRYSKDGACDDGGPNSDYSACNAGEDCGDCGSATFLSEVPRGLIVDCTGEPEPCYLSAVAFGHSDNWAYNGQTTGPVSALRAAIAGVAGYPHDYSNWYFTSAPGEDFAGTYFPASFTLMPEPPATPPPPSPPPPAPPMSPAPPSFPTVPRSPPAPPFPPTSPPPPPLGPGDCRVVGIHTDDPDRFGILLFRTLAITEALFITDDQVHTYTCTHTPMHAHAHTHTSHPYTHTPTSHPHPPTRLPANRRGESWMPPSLAHHLLTYLPPTCLPTTYLPTYHLLAYLLTTYLPTYHLLAHSVDDTRDRPLPQRREPRATQQLDAHRAACRLRDH